MPGPSLKSLKSHRRKAVTLSAKSLVVGRPLFDDNPLPWLIEPAVEQVNLIDWAAESRDELTTLLAERGGILFRGFDLAGTDGLERLIAGLAGESLQYKERSSPRTQVDGNIYTSTDHPADQPIFLHNENSYQQTWPMKIFFYCKTASETGGETPIADCRKVFDRLSPELKQRFLAKQWCYVRTFQQGFGLAWQTVFQTEDKATVERYCLDKGIGVEWQEGDRLQTRAIRPAMALHPGTGAPVWFNHATFFNVATLPEATRKAMLGEFDEASLPANTYYGDGTPIEAETLAELHQAYEAETVKFRWQDGDILMLDNMMVAHGRSPFSGPRKVLVGMAEPKSWDEVSIAVPI